MLAINNILECAGTFQLKIIPDHDDNVDADDTLSLEYVGNKTLEISTYLANGHSG